MPNGKIFCSAVHVVRFYTAMQSIARIGKSLKKTQAPRIYNQHQFAAQTNVYKKIYFGASFGCEEDATVYAYRIHVGASAAVLSVILCVCTAQHTLSMYNLLDAL